jgi:hypothetical protein
MSALPGILNTRPVADAAKCRIVKLELEEREKENLSRKAAYD